MAKEIKFDIDARNLMKEGADALANGKAATWSLRRSSVRPR